MRIPKDGPDVPFDWQIIGGLREQSDKRRGDESLYDACPFQHNWLWHERMLATLEECQALRERVRELEKSSGTD